MSETGRGETTAHRTAVAAAWIGVVGAVVAAVIAGIFGLLSGPGTPAPAQPAAPGTTSSTPQAATSAAATPPDVGGTVRLSATTAGSRIVEVVADGNAVPRPGRAYWFVLEVHGVGDHSEYYPRVQLGSGTRQEFAVDIPAEADAGKRRTGQVYDVSADVSARLAKGAADNDAITVDELTRAPCQNCTVSNQVTLPFTS